MGGGVTCGGADGVYDVGLAPACSGSRRLVPACSGSRAEARVLSLACSALPAPLRLGRLRSPRRSPFATRRPSAARSIHEQGESSGPVVRSLMERLDPSSLPSPCFVVDQQAIRQNLAVLDRVQRESGAKVLLALKGFAMWRLFPLIARTLHGTTASGVHEARLGREHFPGQVHAYCPAYTDQDFAELTRLADHVSFNSPAQWRRFRDRAVDAGLRCAMRVNPQHSEVDTPLYDPCAPGSRLGVRGEDYEPALVEDEALTGLHFHTLCESNVDALDRTLAAVRAQFQAVLRRVSWVNFGGGHHITRADYDVDRLIALVQEFRTRYEVEVYLEPGEAIALHAGVLVCTVLDVLANGSVVLDTSATAHMPDVLEMPYRPHLVQEDPRGEHVHRLGGMTCLAGDVIGDYHFHRPLRPGDKLVFTDMAHYTMVKTTTFNGVNLPAIALHDSATGRTQIVRTFGYDDYKTRLS